MSVYKRGGFYWYDFVYRGKRIQESAKTRNVRIARDLEAAHRTKLVKGELGIREFAPLPLSDFLKTEYLPYVRSRFKNKPNTLRYYCYAIQALNDSDIAAVNLREITSQHAAQFAAKRKGLSGSTINAGLRILRNALRLAVEWGKADRDPKIRLMPEKQRERVLSDAEVSLYLGACDQPWKDIVTIILGTGMRPGEVNSLRWERIAFADGKGALRITEGKSANAKRTLPMVPAVFAVLHNRWLAEEKPSVGWVFPAETKSGHTEAYCGKNQHGAALRAINAGIKKNTRPNLQPFPPYTLRHTALTNLGTLGVDAFTLKAIAGHSSISMTQRYVHPQEDAIERAFALPLLVLNSESNA